MKKQKLLYIINADWYFKLHWFDRAIASTDEYDVYVLCPSQDKEFTKECSSLGIKHVNLDLSRTGKNLLREISSIRLISKAIRSISPDLIHAVTIKPNLYLSILKPRSCSVIMTFAGLGTLRTSSGLFGNIIMSLLKVFLARWNTHKKVICLFENSDDLDFISKGYSIDRSLCKRVFGAGVDVNCFSVSTLPSDETPVILFASRMLKDKGLQQLIDAVKMVNHDKDRCILRVAGIIDSVSPLSYTKNEIETMASQGDFDWLGQRDDIPKLISESLTVCLPTRYGEGTPRILIEALACGRPIITTHYGGCKDICIDGETGFLVDGADVKQLASAIDRIINDSKLAQQMGLKGRELVERQYSNTLIVEQNLNFYKSITSKAV